MTVKKYVYVSEDTGQTLFFDAEQDGRKNFCGIFWIEEEEAHYKIFNGVTLSVDKRKKQEYIESNIDLLRADMYQRVNPARDVFINSGFMYDNGAEQIPFQADPISLQKIGLAKAALDSQPATATIVWTTNQKLENGQDRDYEFSKEEFTEFLNQLVIEGERIHRKAKDLKTEILAAETLESLKSIRISFEK